MQLNDSLEKLVVPRFLRYVTYWTTSSRHIEKTPSTQGQWDLAKSLEQELKDIGVTVTLTDHCYVIARFPASPGKESAPCVGFLAHLDTAEDVSGKDVKPQLVEFDGKRIDLADGLSLDPALDDDLASHKGKLIIHTDGTTLLGADDKAGIAEIMGAIEYIILQKIEHGPIEIIFSPDEETGKGLPEFPLDTIRSKACYTLDGGAQGEAEIECFNAAEAIVSCKGKAIHPGYARGKMANAALMAAAFAVMLPRSESPEATDGYYGYYYLSEIKGDNENASLDILVRDFEQSRIKRRIAALDVFAQAVETQFPGGRVIVEARDQYFNMKEKIDEKPHVLEILKQAYSNAGVECRLKPIRGGTDGSRLTELGIPTPNIFTGGRNWHSRLEWASVPEMIAACSIVVELVKLWGEREEADSR
jgi:tripeptide aminopeptidase